MFWITVLITTFCFCVAFPGESFAYLDPGTGSYIIQILIGAFLGALFTAKIYWRKLKSFFSGKANNNDKDN